MSAQPDDLDGVDAAPDAAEHLSQPARFTRGYEVPWAWWDPFAVFVLSFVLTTVVVSFVVASAPPSLRAAASIAISIPLSLVVTVGWLGARYGRAARAVLGPAPPRARDLLVGAGYGLAAYLLLNLVLVSLLAVLAEQAGFQLPEVQQGLQAAIRDSPLAPLVIVNAVLLAPVGEEVLYRGMLFQALRRRLGPWPAIVLSGVIFGAAHLEWLAVGITGGFGMYLAWLLHRRGSLLVAIAAHSVFNALSVVLLLLEVG